MRKVEIDDRCCVRKPIPAKENKKKKVRMDPSIALSPSLSINRLLTLMLKNFSIPMSAPNPASVTTNPSYQYTRATKEDRAETTGGKAETEGITVVALENISGRRTSRARPNHTFHHTGLSVEHSALLSHVFLDWSSHRMLAGSASRPEFFTRNVPEDLGNNKASSHSLAPAQNQPKV